MDGHRPLLLIRADANGQIGSGHVMRCGALASAWMRRGGRACLVGGVLPPGLQSHLSDLGCEITTWTLSASLAQDAQQLRRLAESVNPAWIVLDGYDFDHDYQQFVCAAPRTMHVLWIDDANQPQTTTADVVLNQNIFAAARNYSPLSATQLLLGPRYALLREEFLGGRRSADQDGASEANTGPAIPRRRRILVTLGGADPANGTAAVLNGLFLLPELPLEIVVVIGASNPHGDSIRRMVETSPLPIQVDHNVRDMARLIRSCDLAIAAAGSTSYELAACGVPAVLLVTAENQAPVAQGFAAAEVALHAGHLADFSPARLAQGVRELLASPERRATMAANGTRLIDGRGADRVAEFLLEQSLQARGATLDDAELLFAWQQDDAVRAASFTAGPRDFAEHVRWFRGALADPSVRIELFQFNPHAVVGCVRFTIRGDAATIGVLVDRRYRGRRLAPQLLRRAIRRLGQAHPHLHRIDAWIKPSNEGSRRAFAAAGFEPQGLGFVQDERAEHWALHFGPAGFGPQGLRMPGAFREQEFVHD